MKINFKRAPLLGLIKEVSITSECSYDYTYKAINKFCGNKPSLPAENRVIDTFKTCMLDRRSTPANRKIIDKILRKYFPDFDLSQGGEK